MIDNNLRFTIILGISSIIAFSVAKASQLIFSMGVFGFSVTMFISFFVSCKIINRLPIGKH